MNPPTVAPPAFLEERQALACVHCGLCLSACPTYLETGNENESPRGRIHLMRAMQGGRLTLNASTVGHLDLCLGCRACEVACPSGVPYGALLESTRSFVEEHYRRPVGEGRWLRWLIAHVFPYPARLRLALAPARWAQALRLQGVLPKTLRDLLALLPPASDRSDAQPQGMHGSLPAFSPATTSTTLGKVGLLTGCVMQVLFRRTHQSTIRVLNAAGYDVVIPPRQGCCGALHAHAGRLDEARAAASHILDDFDCEDLDAIVTNAAGCGSTLKEYGHLLGSDPVRAVVARKFASRVRDLTEVLCDSPILLKSLASRAKPDGERITCHDACHLAHAQGITQAPRRLIHAAAGGRFVEMPECDVCCGSAGSYNLTEPAMAGRLQDRKRRHIQSLGAVTVVTTNPGCLLQIQAGLHAERVTGTRVVHIADWLAEQLPT